MEVPHLPTRKTSPEIYKSKRQWDRYKTEELDSSFLIAAQLVKRMDSILLQYMENRHPTSARYMKTVHSYLAWGGIIHTEILALNSFRFFL